MSVRDKFNRTKRKIIVLSYAGITAAMCGMSLAGAGMPGAGVITAVGVAVGFCSLWYGYTTAFRCPRCGENCAGLALYGFPFLSIDRRITYCPFCGAEIDDE